MLLIRLCFICVHFGTLLVDYRCSYLFPFLFQCTYSSYNITDIIFHAAQLVTKGIMAQFTVSGSHLGVNHTRQGQKMALSESGS
jgi:hypothetical protein